MDIGDPAGGASVFKDGQLYPEEPRNPQGLLGAFYEGMGAVESPFVNRPSRAFDYRPSVSPFDYYRGPRSGQPSEPFRANGNRLSLPYKGRDLFVRAVCAVMAGVKPRKTCAYYAKLFFNGFYAFFRKKTPATAPVFLLYPQKEGFIHMGGGVF